MYYVPNAVFGSPPPPHGPASFYHSVMFADVNLVHPEPLIRTPTPHPLLQLTEQR